MIPAHSYAEPVTTTRDVKPNQVGIYVATTGNVTVTFTGGGVATYTAVPAGTFIPVRVKRITAASANALVLYA